MTNDDVVAYGDAPAAGTGDTSAALWAIDEHGRIFHEGRFVALIERRPDYDGEVTTAYRVLRVEVAGDNPAAPWRAASETRIIGTSEAVRVCAEGAPEGPKDDDLGGYGASVL